MLARRIPGRDLRPATSSTSSNRLPCWPGEYRAVTDLIVGKDAGFLMLPCWPGEYRAVTSTRTAPPRGDDVASMLARRIPGRDDRTTLAVDPARVELPCWPGEYRAVTDCEQLTDLTEVPNGSANGPRQADPDHCVRPIRRSVDRELRLAY